eukprot:XP_001698258.1 predicted protein [Chlamydomonas reinhardtii]
MVSPPNESKPPITLNSQILWDQQRARGAATQADAAHSKRMVLKLGSPSVSPVPQLQRTAAATLLAAGLLVGQAPSHAAIMVEAPARAALVAPPLAPAVVLATTTTAPGLVEEAEELALGVFQFFQHSAEAVGNGVHHLQVVHALERLEGMPLEQVVDVQLLKSAIHPTAMLAAAADDEDVPTSDWVLDGRLLQRDAGAIRRAVHWDKVSEAVRPQQLRRALEVLGGGAGGSPFAELDMRTAVSAVRLEAVKHVLHPVEEAARGRSLESSGMGVWKLGEEEITRLLSFYTGAHLALGVLSA